MKKTKTFNRISLMLSSIKQPIMQKLPTSHKRNMLAGVSLIALILAGCGNSSEPAQAETTLPTPAVNTAQSSATANIPLDSNEEVVAALQANLAASGIDQTVRSASPTDMPGMYWVDAEGLPAFFTDEQGQYIIQGQIVEVGSGEPVDITAQLQAQQAQDKLSQVASDDMIVFPASGETKAAVYVFTDADCGYCRKLHSEMQDINNKGIEVRYLAWPRSPQTEPKMQAIWCSDDRNAAMNRAKAGENISAPSCNNPISEQTALGFSLGVNGTPAIFTESGIKIGGYLPASQLAQVAIANK